ncbi:MAG TPA: methionyl-tRNA formyltransferase [Actinobacteria bacterium]|nr:methionyl-tRNA formyltransferase [Actinomycetota bacterium]
MRTLFLGTPSAAVPSLAATTTVVDVVGVVTRPDAPAGRGRRHRPSPVKVAAVEWGLPLHQPRDADELADLVARLRPDFAVLVAFGMLIPQTVLDAVPAGILNVHFSLLPRWRGAAPVARAILEGDTTTGVTLMLVDEGLDTGPVVAERRVEIRPEDTAGLLTARLAHVGAALLAEVVPDYLSGRRRPVPQLAAGATTAPRLTRSEARLTPGWRPERALRAVRAFQPRPGAWVRLDDGDELKILEAAESEASVDRGRIEEAGGRVVLGLDGGAIELVRVRPEGGRDLTGVAWMHGRRGRAATILP